MANLEKYTFETAEKRQRFLNAHGYNTHTNRLVNVFLSEIKDEEVDEPFVVECIIEIDYFPSDKRY